MAFASAAPVAATIQDDPLVRLRVKAREIIADDIALLTLEPDDEAPLPWWSPGAHIALRTGEDELVREYSLCGSPRDRERWQIAVRLAAPSRGGSHWVHERLHPGADVVVERLSNHFEFRPSARPCFVAGGIGITPILPMIEAAERYGADWTLVYLGRDRARMPFLDKLAAFGPRVRIVETSVSGRMAAAQIVADHRGSHIFSCGPEALLDDLAVAVSVVDDVSLSVERFTPRTIELPAEEIAFDVIVESSGQRVHVEPGCTTLEALLDADVRVPNSCREGTCGSCETVVIDGAPDHRDSILSDEERASGEYMYVCVSRSLTRTLTLDL